MKRERRTVEVDLDPVRYLALLGAGDEDALRYFILVVALLLDPAAVRRVSGRLHGCEALLRLRRRCTLARLEAYGEATSSGWDYTDNPKPHRLSAERNGS